jgi:phosphatidate cytidylyltransferase
MGRDSLFSRSNRENGPEDPAEGVRIIDPGEAADAVERGEVVRRRGGDRPRYGDRPEPPPSDVAPALRFPLADSADASSFERPRVAPVVRRSADDPAPGEAPEEGAGEEPPVLNVEPASGEFELPDWTAPPTGEVPAVILADIDAEDEAAEQERWSSFASSTPRWRDAHDDWDDADVAAELAEAESTLGALDTRERMTQEEFLTFDDLEVPAAPPPSGSAAEPIRIQSSEPRPRPPASGPPASNPRAGRRRAASGPGGGGRAETPPPAGGGGRDVPTAVLVGVGIGAVALVLFKIGPAATMALVVAVALLATVELFNALRRGGYRPATLLGLVAAAALPLGSYWRGEGAIPVVLTLTLVFSLLWYILGAGGDARPIPNIGVTLLGVVYVGLLAAFGALVLDIPAEGVSILLVAVVAAVLYDVGGFFVGRRFGRTPLTAVSPHKTVEGLAGGVASAMVGSFVVAVPFGVGPFALGSWFVFALCCALAAFLGDLAESLLKRDLGIKDMGSILPEHGGVLDRFDGLLFVLPTAYYVVRVLDLVPGL